MTYQIEFEYNFYNTIILINFTNNPLEKYFVKQNVLFPILMLNN